jgi:raffinose/stachyose/melibiose transport system substrate-binding protein
MDRRDLIKRTGAMTAGAALAGGSIPVAGLGVAAVAAQTEEFDVWTTYTDEIRTGIVEDIGATFAEAKDVTFSQRSWQLEELQSTLPRSVDSDQGPDVSQVNNGEALAGPMIRGGQIVSLAEYATEYGWSDRFAESLLARCMYSADGTVFGEGELWGLPAESEIVGFYYNKTIFADNGLSVPTTFAEFEELLAALRAAGVEPLVFGTLDKWQAIHLFGEIQATNTTRDYLDALIYRRGGADFTDQSILDAANKVIEWGEAGYFMEGYDGLSGDDAQALFQTGVGGILLQGSWAAGAVRDSLGEDAGFFLMPRATEDVPVLHVGGVGIPFSITTNAADPAVAASFIDSLVTEESFARFIEAGTLPLGEIPADLITEGTVDGEMYAAWNGALADDAVGHYMDWAAPDFYDVFTGALQELLGGQVTAEEFQTTLQDFYAASFE